MREGEALARHRHWQVAANRSEWHRQERSRCQSSSASSLGSDPLNKRRSVPRLIGVNEGQANDKQSRSSVVTSMTSLLETPRVSILPAPLLTRRFVARNPAYISTFSISISSRRIFDSDSGRWRRSSLSIVRNGDDGGPVAKRIEGPVHVSRDAHCSLRFASLRLPSISCSIDRGSVIIHFSKLSDPLGDRSGFDMVAGKRTFIGRHCPPARHVYN